MQIIELRLATADLSAQRDFYAGVLGMPVVGTPDQLRLQAGSTRLIFEQTEDSAHRYHFAFNIPENQFAEANAWAAARAPLLKDSSGADKYDFQHWNAHALYFRDAAGNVVEFIARHSLPNSSTQPFGSQSLLNVSEIGLGVEGVRAAADWLQSTLNLPVYDGAHSDTFTALGDEQGLFIVVSLGRIWYPETGVPATAAPVRVTLASNVERDESLPGAPYRIRRRVIAGA